MAPWYSAEKKVKTRPYLILIQKSKGSCAFYKQKVKNVTIEYRRQSIFPNPVYQLVCWTATRGVGGSLLHQILILCTFLCLFRDGAEWW